MDLRWVEGLFPMWVEGRGVISDGDDEQLLLLLRGAGGGVLHGKYIGHGGG